MERDLETYKKWEGWHRKMALEEFERKKFKAIEEAENLIRSAKDENQRKSGEGMLRVANKMKFQFEKNGLIQYGYCKRFFRQVTFLPGVCQLETQICFSHRKDNLSQTLT